MSLSKEQQRKIGERLEWLVEDQAFRRRLPTATSIAEAVVVIEAALVRFEEEKIAITGNGRYQAQCAELVGNADAFYGNYSRELSQICLSVFRFAHRVFEDHLGDENGLRTLAVGKTQLMNALDHAFSTIRMLVVDHKE